MRRLIIMISIMFLVSACKHETLKVKKINCEPGKIDFVNQVLPILQSSCATSGCHDYNTQKEGVDMSEYARIINTSGITKGNANSSKMYQVLNKSGDDLMPPSSSGIVLSSAQKDLIKTWINQGAENIECTNFSICDSTMFKFSENVKPLIDASCISCHSTGSTNGVELSTYNEIKTFVDNGKLLSSITHDGNTSPMPKGQAKWDDCKIAIITKWINNGALNN